MKRFLLVALVWLVFFTVPAHAQTVSSWTLKLYNVGASMPLSSTIIQRADVMCNQTPPPSQPLPGSNPTRIAWDDPDNTGRVCIWRDPGTGPLFALPFGGSYEGTLFATNANGSSSETPRVPFLRPGGLPALPSGLRFLP